MKAEGYKVILKNTPRNKMDLTLEADAHSLSIAENKKEVLQCKLKEASDNAMICNCVVDMP